MKKMITFAIMALLIGGFAINADAQAKDKKPTSSQEIDQRLSDFDANIGNCEETNQKLQKVEETLAFMAKATGPSRKHVLNQPTTRSQEKKEKLEKERTELQKKYRGFYKKAEKLNRALSDDTKSMSSNQKSQFDSLKSRFSDLPTI